MNPKILYAVGIGPVDRPGYCNRSVRVLASSERHAFRLAKELLRDGECIYTIVVVEEIAS